MISRAACLPLPCGGNAGDPICTGSECCDGSTCISPCVPDPCGGRLVCVVDCNEPSGYVC